MVYYYRTVDDTLIPYTFQIQLMIIVPNFTASHAGVYKLTLINLAGAVTRIFTEG